MTKQFLNYDKLDDAICEFLKTHTGHPTNSSALCELAATITGGVPWRLIDRRLQAMRLAGRIKYVGRKFVARHGWLVVKDDEARPLKCWRCRECGWLIDDRQRSALIAPLECLRCGRSAEAFEPVLLPSQLDR